MHVGGISIPCYKIIAMGDLLFYILGLAVLAAALYMMKKVASCLIKAVVMAVIVVVLGAVYYLYIA